MNSNLDGTSDYSLRFEDTVRFISSSRLRIRVISSVISPLNVFTNDLPSLVIPSTFTVATFFISSGICTVVSAPGAIFSAVSVSVLPQSSDAEGLVQEVYPS